MDMVKQSRKQELLPIRTMSIVASTGCGVHQEVSSIAGISAFPINPRASRSSLQWSLFGTLVVAISKWIGHSPSQKASQVDDHAV
ncbi:Phosphate-responsive 1 family protein [Prunus dulcis]|uniref:Phosphate-responsive 1 family protein n=1 Tax=Prunus dulcis TaxID=3755 RepID=A0A4Y1QVA8_PRUDU|nr:Phosphate-responsive 1 family protein [Prunus dulcis]